jgi:Amt family ammonium transporter
MSSVTLLIDGTSQTLPLAELTTLLLNASGTTALASGRSLDIFYLLVGSFLVFFMQVGFCFLEVGCVSAKNTKHVLIKNVCDACISAITYYVCGYGFAFLGDHPFIGSSGFFFMDTFYTDSSLAYNGQAYVSWLFQWAFAATAATIVTGAVAERISFYAYIVYAFFLTGFIYPVAVHWLWSKAGWASMTNDPSNLLFGVGAVDFAGSGVIHMTGGVAALVGCIFLGPRQGRFGLNGDVHAMPAQSVLLQTIGTLLLWFGWYGFNCMSTGTLTGAASDVAAKVAVNLTLATAAAGLFNVLLGKYLDGILDPVLANNGVLSGAVAITAGCAVVEPAGAIVIGVCAAVLYTSSSKLLVKCKVDDVVDAVPVHFVCGAWGVLAPGFLASKDGMSMAYGDRTSWGVFYGGGGSFLAAQVVVILAIMSWVGATCTVMFAILKYGKWLRVSVEAELVGLDISFHGGPAYAVENTQSKISEEDMPYGPVKSPVALT